MRTLVVSVLMALSGCAKPTAVPTPPANVMDRRTAEALARPYVGQRYDDFQQRWGQYLHVGHSAVIDGATVVVFESFNDESIFLAIRVRDGVITAVSRR